MNHTRTWSLGLMATSLLAAGLLTGGSDACSCLPPPEPKKALEKATAVFLAKVVEIDDVGNESKTVTLDVEKWWKGGDATRVKVTTASNGAACGFGFQVGGSYLVYSGPAAKGGLLQVSLCSRTRAAKTAEGTGDFKDLGEGTAPKNK